jgi:hypothetical protein
MNQHPTEQLLRTLIACTLWLALLMQPAPVAAALPRLGSTETLLGAYQKDGAGAFSHRWLAYIFDTHVELNGRKLGPYTGISQRFVFDSDGAHIAFAAEKAGQWVIVVDGQEQWQHKGLGWAWYSWGSDLEGNSFFPESQAPIMRFSPSGKILAYMVSLGDEQWGVALNGKPGPAFDNISSDLRFIGERVLYWAHRGDEQLYIYGDETLGPYDEVRSVALSADGKHFVFAALRGAQWLLVHDGREQEITGELYTYTLGPTGELVYATTVYNMVRITFNGKALPGAYSEVWDLTISPDGKHLAFWGKKDGRWSVFTDQQTYPGLDGRYFYQVGAERYALMWSHDSAHLAYFARKNEQPVLMLDGKIAPEIGEMPGFAMRQYVNDEHEAVGLELMQAPQFDRQGFVACLLGQPRLPCDPYAVTLVGAELAGPQTDKEQAYMVIGSRKQGPYPAIESVLLISPDAKHYTYIVRTAQGQQVVVDGELLPATYEAIYRPQYIGTAELAYLGIKAGQVYSVRVPLSDG